MTKEQGSAAQDLEQEDFQDVNDLFGQDVVMEETDSEGWEEDGQPSETGEEEVGVDDAGEEKAPKIDPTVQALIEHNKQLVAQIQQLQSGAPQKQEEQKTPELPAFASAEEVSKILDEGDAETFNAVMQKAATFPLQQIARVLPGMIQNIVNGQVEQKSAVQTFYTNHPDLVPYRQHLPLIAQELERQHPNLSAPELYEMTAKEFRKRFNMAAPGSKAPKRKPSGNPAPTGRAGGGSPRPKARVDDAAQAMADDIASTLFQS